MAQGFFNPFLASRRPSRGGASTIRNSRREQLQNGAVWCEVSILFTTGKSVSGDPVAATFFSRSNPPLHHLKFYKTPHVSGVETP
jgi:hypothetical protein